MTKMKKTFLKLSISFLSMITASFFFLQCSSSSEQREALSQKEIIELSETGFILKTSSRVLSNAQSIKMSGSCILEVEEKLHWRLYMKEYQKDLTLVYSTEFDFFSSPCQNGSFSINIPLDFFSIGFDYSSLDAFIVQVYTEKSLKSRRIKFVPNSF